MLVQNKHALVSSEDQDGIELGQTAGREERGESLSSEPRSRASTTSQQESRLRSPTFSPVALDQAPTVLTFTNLTVTTKKLPHKVLLDDISGSITGGFWAIMGASGGGKTTLLSTLSLRLDSSVMDIQGEFRLNGREYSRSVLKTMSAYVMQDDLMHAELTVQETLQYSAELRMDPQCSQEERAQRIDTLLNLLGIDHTRNTIIGDSRRKGISGGERKRVSVAIELLNRPKLLFLDEPTSGLDSTTAFTVTKSLKVLSEQGECTVVCTIHQPMPKIFRLFDNLILMKKGKIVYQGHAMKTVLFLEHIGHPCPPDMNLADHLLDVISPARDDVEKLDAHGKLMVPVHLDLGHDKPLYTTEGARSWIREFSVLTRRNMQQYLRRYDIILFNLAASVIMAIFVGFGFWNEMGNKYDSINKRTSSFFFGMVNQGVIGSLQAVTAFPTERAIMLRERASGSYSTSSYFMARTLVDSLTMLWPPIIYTCIVYWNIGYQKVASKFFINLMFHILDAYAATALATLVVCTCVSIERSTVVLSFLFEVTRLFGGLYTSPALLEDYPDWRFADALSYIKYGFVGVALNELTGLDYDCPPGATPACRFPDGQAQIEFFGYDKYTIGACAGYLVVLIVGFRFLGYLGLRFIKV